MKTTRARARRDSSADAVFETMRLYHAWIGYLLTRLGERTVRVQAEDIRASMDKFQCLVSREGDAYVIRLSDLDTAPRCEKEGCEDGDRNGIPSDPCRGGEHGGD